MRYAQILNNKVHWIFEDFLTLDEIYAEKFNPNQIRLIDISAADFNNVREGFDYDGVNFTDPNVLTLDEAKARYIKAAGAEFAKRRDAVTWTQHEAGLYGYDRKSEDVTNFLAAMQRAALGCATGFNVYVDSNVQPKQFLPHTYDMFKIVLEQSASEQIAAYQWYEGIKAALQAATTSEELETIYPIKTY